MRLLYFGDVVGMEAARLLAEHMPRWRAEKRADVVIANVENAHVHQLLDPRTAYGVSREIAGMLTHAGVDALTGGNHSWDSPADEVAYGYSHVLRPQNVTHPSHGRGVLGLHIADRNLIILNLIGQSAVHPPMQARSALEVFEEFHIDDHSVVFIDFHAESIVEKRTFAHAIDGRATAIVGSHTHEPTLLLERFQGGTFFVGDAGMCGPSGGVAGIAPDWHVRMMRKKPEPGFSLARGPIQIGAIFFDFARGHVERFSPHIAQTGSHAFSR